MYKEIDENGQYQLDCRLSSERNLEENTNVMISFAHDILKRESGAGPVKNRHEGYGILAEAFCNLNLQMKVVKNGMTDFLMALPKDDVQAVDAVSSVGNALADAIVAAVTMAAEAKRISDDLYDSAAGLSPLEEYAERQEDDDGFSEPENDEEDDSHGEDAV